MRDISNSEYKDSIEYLKYNRIIKGYEDWTFKPDNKINRVEFIKIVIEWLGISPDGKIYNNCFPDVNDQWFSKYVCYWKERWIIKWYPDWYYKPSNEINYVESLKIIYEGNNNVWKINAHWKQWYSKYIEDAQDNNITLDELWDKYNFSLTRWQVSWLIYNFIKKKIN